MKIGISGVTSFTGSWIAREFSRRGHTVFGLCSSCKDQYPGLIQARIQKLLANVELIENIKVETGQMAQWIGESQIEIWIHHHHYMKDFRKPNYDYSAFEKICIDPLSDIFESLKKCKARGIIYSGSYFEPGEGGEIRPPPTPYAASKLQVWNELQKSGLPVSKIVIPNPIGSFENPDRLIPQMIEAAKSNQVLEIQTPHFINDHLPVEILASEYVDAAERLKAKEQTIRRPSGWIGSNLDWVEFVNSEFIKKYFAKTLRLKISDNSSRLGFTNSVLEKKEIHWSKFFSNYHQPFAFPQS